MRADADEVRTTKTTTKSRMKSCHVYLYETLVSVVVASGRERRPCLPCMIKTVNEGRGSPAGRRSSKAGASEQATASVFGATRCARIDAASRGPPRIFSSPDEPVRPSVHPSVRPLDRFDIIIHEFVVFSKWASGIKTVRTPPAGLSVSRPRAPFGIITNLGNIHSFGSEYLSDRVDALTSVGRAKRFQCLRTRNKT